VYGTFFVHFTINTFTAKAGHKHELVYSCAAAGAAQDGIIRYDGIVILRSITEGEGFPT
jgi:hypothetical protein